MLNSEDMIVWDRFKKTVTYGNFEVRKEELPSRMKVHRKENIPLPSFLDLHRMTINEAYERTLAFVKKHHQLGTKQIQIITGKGRNGCGIIHGEFMGWLQTNIFKEYVRDAKWTNDGGAVSICLKKSK